MKGIIKVNFNNAKIKIPTLNPVTVVWKNTNKILFSHDNLSKFDECKMIVYSQGEELFQTNTNNFSYTLSDIPANKTIKLEIILEAKVSHYKTASKTNYILIQGTICSDNIVCSDELFCKE